MSRGMGGAQARYVGSCLSDTANPLHHNGFLMRADAENQKRQMIRLQLFRASISMAAL